MAKPDAALAGSGFSGRREMYKRVKIDTLNLELGMYVAQLDRPWLETPFLFQGFEIREDSEIALLRKFCKHVYVDVDRGTVPRDKILAAHNSLGREHDPFQKRDRRLQRARPKRPSLRYRLLSKLSRFDRTGWLERQANGQVVYQNKVSTRQEAPRATHAYGIAVDTMNEVLEEIRKGSAIDLDRIKTAVTPMIDSVLRNQDAMAWLVYLRKRDEYAYNHSIASSVWAVILGRHLGFDRNGIQTLAMGGMLLDVGKVKIPASIISKQGPLTEEEHQIMQMHVDYSVQIAKKTPGMNDRMLDMIRSHHERYDGSGYPQGLKGNEIPVFGRISGIVDCYDAMISKRAYAPARSSYDAVRELNRLAGSKFQRELVEQFVQALGMFPTGSIVELNTGEVGIVVEQNRVRRLRPKIMLLRDADQQPVATQRLLDLKKLPEKEGEKGARWIIKGHEPGAFGIDPADYFH
ncbi:MAG: HD-GYP domain-containing protein [Gammaproteobacteria bacterium]|nr:MAG: HD-GYP domain-containing protein [Gammaproteobacteria bacterium]